VQELRVCPVLLWFPGRSVGISEVDTGVASKMLQRAVNGHPHTLMES
jgi:hypothetical protein